jgi:hypothetical protein
MIGKCGLGGKVERVGWNDRPVRASAGAPHSGGNKAGVLRLRFCFASLRKTSAQDDILAGLFSLRDSSQALAYFQET